MLPLIALLALPPDRVGTKHFVDPNHLAKPSKSIISIPKRIKTEKDAPLKVPPGFKINVFAKGLTFPRWLAIAPNGDVFCVESSKDRITVLRDQDGDGVAETQHVFTVGLKGPHGVQFHDGYLYVANTNGVVRFKYRDGQLQAEAPPEVVIKDIPGNGYNMHWTRDLLFTPDNRLLVTVGSNTNDDIDAPGRGAILSYKPDGTDRKIFASGIRNPVGVAIRPGTNELWTTCVERDFMGNDCPPDYVTRVKEGQFFGWPWFYIGQHRDPKHLKDTPPRSDVTVPDLLVEPHSIPLGILFYTGTQFPAEYRGSMFLGMRGSTNRVPRSGYKVVRVSFPNGKLNPVYEDFIVGWVPDRMKKDVYGRPTGVSQAKDGAMLIVDEWGHKIWRVTFSSGPKVR